MALVVIAAACGYFVPAMFNAAGVAAIVLAVVVFSDLGFTVRALRGKLRLQREFPLTVTVTRRNSGWHVLHNGSAVRIRARIYEDALPAIEKRCAAEWIALRAGATARRPLDCTFNKRGEQPLGGAGVRALAGLGFWIVQFRFELQDKVNVYPLIEEFSQGDLFAHRRRLYSLGQHQSRKFGRGTEFDRLRDYTPDDEFRIINWKATARAGRPVVNAYQVEQSRELMLLLDCGRLMHTEIEGRPRLDRYLDAAIHLAYVALNQKDRVGLVAFDQQVRQYVKPGRRHGQLDSMIDAVFDLQPRFVESDYAMAVSTVKSRQPKRGLVVLFTDLVDSVSSRRAVANLSRLARSHLPVVVILDDPEIERLSGINPQRPADAYVRAAAEQSIEEKQQTLLKLRQGGCLIVNTSAARVNTALVNEYLQVKARNLL